MRVNVDSKEVSRMTASLTEKEADESGMRRVGLRLADGDTRVTFWCDTSPDEGGLNLTGSLRDLLQAGIDLIDNMEQE